MKTPRELLLERHRAAEPKLNTIRREVLQELERRAEAPDEGQAPDPFGGARTFLSAATGFAKWAINPRLTAVRTLLRTGMPTGMSELRPSWRKLLLSFRWHLAGLSAAWLIVLALNIDHSPAPSLALAKQNLPSPQQLLTALRENRRQVLEMTGPTITDPVPESRRRSELEMINETALV